MAKLGALCAYRGSGSLVGRVGRTDFGVRGDHVARDRGCYVVGSFASLAALRNVVARRFAR
jgi:hypothetical protein